MIGLKKIIFNKLEKGSILMEALLMIGILVVMTPIIIESVQKRNEDLQASNLAQEFITISQAATNYIYFEKDNIGKSMPSVKKISGEKLKSILIYYGLPASFKMTNQLEMQYEFIIHKTESVTNVDGQSVKDFNLDGYIYAEGDRYLTALKRNNILKNLGFNGAVFDEEKEMFSNSPAFSIDQSVKGMIQKNSIIIKTKDEVGAKDFLALDDIPEMGKIVNTMLVRLDLNGNNVENVKELDSLDMNISSKIVAKELNSAYLELETLRANNFNIFTNIDFTGNADIKIKNLLANQVNTSEINVNGIDIYGTFQTYNMTANTLKSVGDVNIETLGYSIISAEIIRAQGDDGIEANNFQLSNALIIDSQAIINPSDNSDADLDTLQVIRIDPNNKTTFVNDIILPSGDSLSDKIIEAFIGIDDVFQRNNADGWEYQ